MRITLVRHTQPKAKEETCYGITDLEVDESYAKQLETIKTRISTEEGTIFYTSPLTTCATLAKDLAGEEFSVEREGRIIELSFGTWEAKKWSMVPKKEMEEWAGDYLNNKVHGGESFTELSERVNKFWSELLETETKHAVIVTHSNVIRAILARLLETSLRKSFSLIINHGGVVEISMLDKENAEIEFVK